MGVFTLTTVLLLLLADGVLAKRFDGEDPIPKNLRKAARQSVNNIAPKGQKQYRCVDSSQEIPAFDCSNENTKCQPNIVSDGCSTGKCLLVTCKDSSETGRSDDTSVKTIEDLEKLNFELMDVIPFACVKNNLDDAEGCDHNTCYNGMDYTEKDPKKCSPGYECKIKHCMINQVAKNNVLVGRNTPGLYTHVEISGGHNLNVFAPWKCVPKGSDATKIGKEQCNSYKSCYDKKSNPMNKGKCSGTFDCMFVENCPYALMHKPFNSILNGNSTHEDWGTSVYHGNPKLVYIPGIHGDDP